MRLKLPLPLSVFPRSAWEQEGYVTSKKLKSRSHAPRGNAHSARRAG